MTSSRVYRPRSSRLHVGIKRRGGSLRSRGAKRARYRGRSGYLRKRRAQPETGSYQQFTNEASAFGKRVRRAVKRAKLVDTARESVIFSYKAVKNFDDYGFYWMRNAANGSDRSLPVYACLLNGISSNAAPGVQPIRSLWARVPAGATDGSLYWTNETFIEPTTGLATRSTPNIEYVGGSALGSQSRLYWDWSEIKLNLWGAKNKAVKWVVQIVKVTEAELSPWFSTSVTSEGQQCWEEAVKQFTFNPIDKLNYEKRNGIKVLKSWERVIQPTSNTENDADPHVHTLKWFSRWNRPVSFNRLVAGDVSALKISDDAELVTAKEHNQAGQYAYSNYPYEKAQVFLLIRASDYTDKAFEAVSNSLCGSFDISVRSKFTRLD